MSLNCIKRETAICNYVCGGYYIINYNHCGVVLSVEGLLEHYCKGNIILLSEDGLYHIKIKDVVLMKPIKMPSLDKFNERYQELLKTLQEDDVRH